MSLRAVVENVTSELRAQDAYSREKAASELADWAESDSLSDEELRLVFSELSTVVAKEENSRVTESVWHALSQIAMSNRGQNFNWDFVSQSICSLQRDCLEFALVCLGFSGEARFLPVISAQFANADPEIQTAARTAYEECIFRSEARA
ncbi:MAG: hypothetical protein U0744_20990 [Gemmataceae bacterium]